MGKLLPGDNSSLIRLLEWTQTSVLRKAAPAWDGQASRSGLTDRCWGARKVNSCPDSQDQDNDEKSLGWWLAEQGCGK